jgi:hypothetical protein
MEDRLRQLPKLGARLVRGREYVAHNVVCKDPASAEPTWVVETARFLGGPTAVVMS